MTSEVLSGWKDSGLLVFRGREAGVRHPTAPLHPWHHRFAGGQGDLLWEVLPPSPHTRKRGWERHGFRCQGF